MQLYISSISNLADARFFSAYGISHFGFCFDVLDPNSVTIDKAKEIISWLHEPGIIGQFGHHQTGDEINFINDQLPLYAVQIAADHPGQDLIKLPKWIIDPKGIIEKNSSGVFLSRDWTPELLQEALARKPFGIHIACTKESSVEYYSELMEILEPHLTE